MSILNLAKCHFLNLIFAGFSMLNFFWDTSAACRVSTFDKIAILMHPLLSH